MTIVSVDTSLNTVELLQAKANLMSSGEAAHTLGITQEEVSRLVRQGRLGGVKIGRKYVLLRESVDSLGYIPARGRPKLKRKYTKRSQR